MQLETPRFLLLLQYNNLMSPSVTPAVTSACYSPFASASLSSSSLSTPSSSSSSSSHHHHHHPDLDASLLCSLQEELVLKNLKVRVENRGELTISFCGSKERDEDNMLCEMDVTLPPRNDRDVSAVKVLHCSCC